MLRTGIINFIPVLIKQKNKMKKQLKYKNKTVSVNLINSQEHLQKWWNLGIFYELDMLTYIQENYNVAGLTIADVGACIGNHTLFFAKIMNAEKVYSFEPVPELYERIKDNLKLNGITNVELHNIALSNRKRLESFELCNLNSNAGMSKLNSKGEMKVKADRLDNFTFDKLHILKVDVEDCNSNFLSGAKKTISTHKPDIFIEAANDFEEIKSELGKLGYIYTGKVFCKTPTYLFTYEHNSYTDL